MNDRKRAYKKALDKEFKYWAKKIFDLFSLQETKVMNNFVYFILNKHIPLDMFFKEKQYTCETTKCQLEMGRDVYHRYYTRIHLFIMKNFNTKSMKVYYDIENKTLACKWIGVYEEYWYKLHPKSNMVIYYINEKGGVNHG